MRIEHRMAVETVGVADDEYVAAYVVALTEALKTDYPHADVDVNLRSDFCNACQTLVSDIGTDDDYCAIADDVRQTANIVWGNL